MTGFSDSTATVYMYIKHFLKNIMHLCESHGFCFSYLHCKWVFLLDYLVSVNAKNRIWENTDNYLRVLAVTT